jgi:glutamate formiminotransferase/formiminotetrahydrofolate cyclodeaminase
MSQSIVECIANYSEARRPEVVQAIAQAITSIPGVYLLDTHSDMDHNRTVLTFIGAPAPIEEAAFRSIAKAASLINLDEHSGEHPRIGATDVVPFVPISGVTMNDCVQIAQRLGKRVGDELHIPVYLYEEAATRPERQNLENIRKGQYEALKIELGSNPERQPDFGPNTIGPAGATVIGARQPLIAFNVYLNSDQVSVAEKIARAIRQSSGGLRYVKALGMLVDGRAQVSMNLTNFHKTPVARVVEMIRREAERYGVSIHHSELVGLIPQEALVDAAAWYLQLDQFEPDQILEQRMYAALQGASRADHPVQSHDFLDKLAAGTPAPGGGAASAHVGAVGAALVAMVARLTIGKKKYAQVETEMAAILEQAELLRIALQSAVEKDSIAFEMVMAAYKLPKETEAEQQTRNLAIEQALLGASQVPLDVARKAVKLLKLAAQVISQGNINAISDGGAAASMARAALSAAGLNVRINAQSLHDQNMAQNLLVEIQGVEERAQDLETEIRAALQERGGLGWR